MKKFISDGSVSLGMYKKLFLVICLAVVMLPILSSGAFDRSDYVRLVSVDVGTGLSNDPVRVVYEICKPREFSVEELLDLEDKFMGHLVEYRNTLGDDWFEYGVNVSKVRSVVVGSEEACVYDEFVDNETLVNNTYCNIVPVYGDEEFLEVEWRGLTKTFVKNWALYAPVGSCRLVRHSLVRSDKDLSVGFSGDEFITYLDDDGVSNFTEYVDFESGAYSNWISVNITCGTRSCEEFDNQPLNLNLPIANGTLTQPFNASNELKIVNRTMDLIPFSWVQGHNDSSFVRVNITFQAGEANYTVYYGNSTPSVMAYLGYAGGEHVARDEDLVYFPFNENTGSVAYGKTRWHNNITGIATLDNLTAGGVFGGGHTYMGGTCAAFQNFTFLDYIFNGTISYYISDPKDTWGNYIGESWGRANAAGNTDYGRSRFSDDSKLYFVGSSTDGYPSIASGKNGGWGNKTWWHVSWNFNTTGSEIHINGVEDIRSSNVIEFSDPTGIFEFGCRAVTGSEEPLTFEMDEFLITERVINVSLCSGCVVGFGDEQESGSAPVAASIEVVPVEVNASGLSYFLLRGVGSDDDGNSTVSPEFWLELPNSTAASPQWLNLSYNYTVNVGWEVTLGVFKNLDSIGTYNATFNITDASASSLVSVGGLFSVNNTVPSAPVLSLPANLTNHTSVPVLNWSNSSDLDGDVLNYYLVVDGDNNFGSVDYVNASVGETVSPTADVGVSVGEGLWFWRVLGFDGFGNSSWSGVGAFTVDSSAPAVDFVLQSPGDIDAFNVLVNDLNVTYNVSDVYTAVDSSSVVLRYKVNSSSVDYGVFTNGSVVSGYLTAFVLEHNYDVDLWNFSLNDAFVYPATYNLDEVLMRNETRSEYVLDKSNEWLKVELLNVSGGKNFSVLEVAAENRSASSNALRVYYCNSSYSSGSPVDSVSCTNFYNLEAGPTNHTHSGVSIGHYLVPLAVDVGSGLVGDVVVTPVSNFLFRGTVQGGGWNVSYVGNLSRAGACEVSSNSGAAWSELGGTADVHLHQYDGSERFFYYVCADDVLGTSNCSEAGVRSDAIGVGGLEPSSADVYSPTRGNYSGLENLSVAWLAALSPNGDDIAFYNVSLVGQSEGFSQFVSNVSGGVLNVSWDVDDVLVDGVYKFRVEACDVEGRCSFGFSEEVEFDTSFPQLVVTEPTNRTYYGLSLDLRYVASGFNVTKYSLDGGANVSLVGNTQFSTTAGAHSLVVYAEEYRGNLNFSSVSFYVDMGSDTLSPGGGGGGGGGLRCPEGTVEVGGVCVVEVGVVNDTLIVDVIPEVDLPVGVEDFLEGVGEGVGGVFGFELSALDVLLWAVLLGLVVISAPVSFGLWGRLRFWGVGVYLVPFVLLLLFYDSLLGWGLGGWSSVELVVGCFGVLLGWFVWSKFLVGWFR